MNERGDFASFPAVIQEASTDAQASTPESVRRQAVMIGECVRQARFAANMTQQELAGDTYSKSYISALERGKMTPSIQALQVLAVRLKVPVSYLLGESEAEAGASSERERQEREEALRRVLSEAEVFIRQDQPGKALELLPIAGGEPPADLALYDHPRWYWLVGWALLRQGKYEEAKGWLAQGLKLAGTLRTQAPDSRRAHLSEMAERARDLLGGCYYQLSQPGVALEYHSCCLLAISEGAITHPELILRIYRSLGNDHLAMGRNAVAVGFFLKAIKQAEDMNDPRQLGLTYWGLGLAYLADNDLRKARDCFMRALTIFGELKKPVLASRLRSMLGLLLIELEDYQLAENLLSVSLREAEEINDTHAHGVALGCLAKLRLAQGDPNAAIKTALESLAVIGQSDDYRSRGQVNQTLGEAYEARQDMPTAEQAYREALAVLGQTQDGRYIRRARERYGQFLVKQGRLQEAYEQMSLAYEIAARPAPAL